MPSQDYEETRERLRRIFDKQLFFIIGVAKSGTTWLELLLDAHLEIACKGEAHFGDVLRQSFREALNDYNARLKEVGGHTNEMRYDARDHDHLMITGIGLMYAKWADDPAIRCIGEKTPAHLRTMPLLNRYFPEAKFIHIIRDGRDAAVSGWFFNVKRNPAAAKSEFGDLAGFVRYFAGSWAEKVQSAREFAETLGDRYLELRYEQLVGDPEAEVVRMLDFLGADAAPAAVAKCLEGSRFDKLAGGRKPGEEDAASFYRKGVVGDWQNHFDNADVAAFEESAGALLKELGYE